MPGGGDSSGRYTGRPHRDPPPVLLSPEITRDNALAMMRWLEDEEVTRFLSDSRHVSRDIERVVSRVHLPTLTHLFSQGGRFFMVCDPRNVPVGFVRLVGHGASYELVIVIGERSNWGRRLGTTALQQSLKKAFLELRAEKLVARIHPGNVWSIRVFSKLGFLLERETPSLMTFTLTQDRYLALARRTAARAADICITRLDRDRLQKLIAMAGRRRDVDQQTLGSLASEIERAIILPSRQVAPDVITMNSRAQLRVNDELAEVALVYPEHADAGGSPQKISVLSPVGTAILGFREGDVIDWPDRDGQLKIQITKVLHQPEAAGDYHL